MVGGGISGLSALHEFEKEGIDATLYEMNPRIGGRIWSVDNINDTRLFTNIGAELVDSTHTKMLSLMDEFGVEKMERVVPEGYTELSYISDGKPMTMDEAQKLIYAKNKNALMRFDQDMIRLRKSQKLGIVPNGAIRTVVEMEIDKMSIAEYLKKINANAFLTKWVRAAMGAENGIPIEKQSAMVLFDYMQPDLANEKLLFLPGNDEKYRIKGGSGKLTNAIYERYKKSIELEKKLLSIESTDGKTFRLTFKGSAGIETIEADHVVLAVPFYQLKDVKINIPGMTSNHLNAISETTYGRHTKFLMYFKERPWNKVKHYGTAISDMGYLLWDSSEGQSGTKGSLTAYFGGDMFDEKKEVLEKKILAQIDSLFPGTSKEFIASEKFDWASSYSGPYKPGEYSKINLDLAPAGNLHFVGEHISEKHRGYMNGAAETGENAAKKIVKILSVVEQGNSCQAIFHSFFH